MRKNSFALTATILNGIEMGILVLFTLFFMTLRNSSDFKDTFISTMEQQGMDMASYGLSFEELMTSAIVIVALVAIYSITKFVFSFIGYLKNNPTMILVSAILSTISTVAMLLTFSIIFIAVEGIITGLLFAAYSTMKKSITYNNTYPNNNQNVDDKTVIDIEL